MWMEWTDWNVSVARRMAEVMAIDPAALVRFDFTGEGWGFSFCPEHPFPDGSIEAYGEGLSPRSAVEDALDKIHAVSDAA